jgi:hypothetical protein
MKGHSPVPQTYAQRKASRIARGLSSQSPRSKGHADRKGKRSSGHSRTKGKRSSGSSHPASGSFRQKRVHDFIGWDGEGVTDPDGTHRYTLLANSRGEYLERHSITTVEALDFILAAAARYPKAVHVIFGGGYDITMWLRDLSRKVTMPVVMNETNRLVHVPLNGRLYAMTQRPRKWLKLARFRDASQKFVRKGKAWTPDYDGSLTIWEVFGFFQAPFVSALRSYGIAIEGDMEAMKAARSSFTDAQAVAIREYCLAECRALEALMLAVDDSLQEARLFPARWDGAGAVASALLKREGVKEHIAPEPEHLIIPVATAFFGGRIELLKMGRAHRKVYNYDIASAYPAVAANLPTLHGEWKHDLFPASESSFTIARIEWAFPEGQPWYPLPFRKARDGTITFPAEGGGWYWQPEYLAARAWCHRIFGHARMMRRIESWTLVPSDQAKPFGFVPELFAQRQVYKREGNGAEKALKLALNSLYGKTAQQVGAKPGKPPPYFSLCWAGYITSATRARLVLAGCADPHAVIAFATDGIYSTRPLPLTCEKGALGAWEGPTVNADAVFVQAGIYWLRDGDGWASKYRGFDKEGMRDPAFVLEAWNGRKATIGVPSTRFITASHAVLHASTWKQKATWRTIDRALCLDGRCPKRQPIPLMPKGEYAPAGRLVPLPPTTNVAWDAIQGISAPYDTFRLGEIDGQDEESYAYDVTEGTL